jgi:hypothetical protein
MLRKELWTRSPFPDVAVTKDRSFVFSPAVHQLALAVMVIALIADKDRPRAGKRRERRTGRQIG